MLFLTVLAYFAYSLLTGRHELGPWWLLYWFGATVLSGIVVGIPNGLITGWMSIREREDALGTVVALVGATWVVAAAGLTWFMSSLVAGWIE
ncbi:MAG TPA: hypothetical protein VF655_04685 [Allosphingosinicella sp.]